MTEVRYKGATTVTVTPDYSEASKFADIWLNPKQGTDAALALAMGHVILKEWHLEGRSAYFEDYCRRYTDMPLLVTLRETDGGYVPDRMLRAADLPGALEQTNNPEWKTVAIDENEGRCPGLSGRLDRLPLGRNRQVEHRGERRRRTARPPGCGSA